MAVATGTACCGEKIVHRVKSLFLSVAQINSDRCYIFLQNSCLLLSTGLEHLLMVVFLKRALEAPCLLLSYAYMYLSI